MGCERGKLSSSTDRERAKGSRQVLTGPRGRATRFLGLGLALFLLVARGMAFLPKVLAVYYVNRGWPALNRALLTELDEASRGEALVRARSVYQEALRWDRANRWAHHNLGAIYLAEGQRIALGRQTCVGSRSRV